MSFIGVDRRCELEQMVQSVLDSADDGRIVVTQESQSVDFKEEAGRRNGPEIEPGVPQNPAAAVALADEVACMANSPGGGALIVGVEDGSGRVIGTELDVDWLRDSIYRKIGIAPDIRASVVEGLRILVVYVAEAREPVTDTGGRIRWRVADNCRPVDRAEWWEHRDQASNADPMAAASARTTADIRPMAMEIARRWYGADAGTDEELLRKIGALRSDGRLTQAGTVLFTPVDRAVLEFTEFDVPGGLITNSFRAEAYSSLLEQIVAIETAISGSNTYSTVAQGIHHEQIRRVPESAVREAVLNGVIHRDWNRSEPTDVRWIEFDSTLIVRSPGAFPGGVTAENILSNRKARYPALADLFRALGLVDKQGVGVDRMYRDMIVLGHRPPEIIECPGRYVECTLVGGAPVFPVVECVRAIAPAERQRDMRVAIILHLLLHHAFVTVPSVARALQSTPEAARVALQAVRQSTVRAAPLVRSYKQSWILGIRAVEILAASYELGSPFPMMPYLSTDVSDQTRVAREWIDSFGAISTGDLQELTGTSRGTVKRTLDAMVQDGIVEQKGAGRSSRYVCPAAP